MKKMTLVLLFSCWVFHPAIAKHTLPVFSGYWYDACLDARRDTCNQLHCNAYHYFMQSEKDLASVMLQNPPEHPECKWGDVYFASKGSAKPYIFPGDDYDWRDVQQANPDFTTRIWMKDCSTSSGKIFDQVSAILYPLYQCSLGSRYAMFDREVGEISDSFGGCATKPYLCASDVVGRDILSDGAVGHVGMITTTMRDVSKENFVPQVLLEVLDKKPVVQTNTLENFKAAGPVYWGAKYSLPNISYIDWLQELYIYNASRGKDLGACQNLEYDLRPSKLHPCQFDPDKGYTLAVLRCDYFVYMSYYLGAQIKILDDFDLTTTPAKLFNAFLNVRFEGDLVTNYRNIVTDPNLEFERRQRRLDHFSWFLQERYVENVFSKPYFDLYGAELAENIYLKINNLESNVEKARFLWNLALKYQEDKNKFSYLVSAITDLKPLELIDVIISEYYQQTNVVNKLILLQNIGYLHINGTLANKKIEDLFKDILFHEKNMEVLSKVIMTLPLQTPTEKLMLINQAFHRVDIGDDLKKEMFAIRGFYASQLEMILSSTDLQKEYLKTFFDQVNQAGNKQFLSDALYNIFVAFDGNFHYEGGPSVFNPMNLEKLARPILLDYLENNKPPFPSVGWHKFLDFAANCEYYKWLRTYFSVQSASFEESEKKIADYIKGIDDFIFKAEMLLCLDRSIYRTQFSIDELSRILQTAQVKLDIIRKNSQKNKVEEDIYLDAVIEKVKQQIDDRAPNHLKKKLQIFIRGKLVDVEQN